MRILHVVPSYFPAHRYGGPIVSVHTLNRALVKLGADVTVYTTNIDGKGTLDVPLGEEVMIDGVRVVYFPITWRPWVYARAMHRALAEHSDKFDLIHITSVFLSASALGARYAKKFRVPYLISPRGSLMKEPLAMKRALLKRFYLALVERKNLADAAAIHFTVPKEEEEYREAGLPLGKSIVIPNAFELPREAHEASGAAFRERYRIQPSLKVVLAMGRINWKKGFDTLVPAFAKVAKEMPETRLVIAGNDEEGYVENVKALISNFKLEDRIIFTGHLNGIQKWNAFAASDVFTLPSYSENFGMAVVEAMAMGVPVVVSERVGVAPYVRKAGAGMVVRKEVGEVMRALIETLEDSARAKEMGTHGMHLAREEFSPEKVAREFISAYNDVVELWRQSSTSSFSLETRN